MIRSRTSGLLSRVFTLPRAFDRYRDYCRPGQYQAIRTRAHRLRGLRLVEISSSPHAGEAARQLHSFAPILVGLGLDVRWYTMLDCLDFFTVAKKIENLLQGDEGHLIAHEIDQFRRVSVDLTAEVGELDADLLVVHDIPAIGVANRISPRPKAGLLWRSHLDLCHPNFSVLSFLQPFWRAYTAIVLQFPEYTVSGLARSRQRFVADAIDPLALRNQLIHRETAREAMGRLGIDPSRPVVSFIGSLVANSDVLSIIQAFFLAREAVPGLQLALLVMAAPYDDPTADTTARAVRTAVAGEADIHLYSGPEEARPLAIAAFQTASDAVIVFSRHAGFGLDATEAMWKGNAVVARDTGGLREQITDGENGFLVGNIEQCAECLVRLVRDRALAERLGQRAHQTVAERFLLPRLIDDCLTIYEEVSTQLLGRVA